METFYFFIPQEVVASMGLSNDGLTISRWVRIGNLFAEGTLSANDYRALAMAGVVVIEMPVITFLSIEETPIGWVCQQGESLSHPNSRPGTLNYLRGLFPEGQPLEEWYTLTPEIYQTYQRLAPLVGSEVIAMLLGSTCHHFEKGIAIIQDTNLVSVFFLDNPNGYSYFSILGEERDDEVEFELPQNHILLVYGYVK
jgi:hypothetical protein